MFVSAKGEFLGGAIAPGVEVSSEAAAARLAALRRVKLTTPRSVVGKNTVECMQTGAVFGFAGLVDGLLQRISDDVDGFAGDDIAVVAIGHIAPLLLPDMHTVEHYDPHLTLEGLRPKRAQNRPESGRLSLSPAPKLGIRNWVSWKFALPVTPQVHCGVSSAQDLLSGPGKSGDWLR
jgi:type III pantothenate kinase